MSSSLLFCCLVILQLTVVGLAGTPRLHSDEVGTLREIARILGRRDWDFTKDPCSGDGNWNIPKYSRRNGLERTFTCDCSFDGNSSCYLVGIALPSQNISSGVPPEFSRLRHLTTLDLSRNYFSGTIPAEWSTMHLEELYLMGNKLSGGFPKVLTSITTLTHLSIEGNLFSGPIPQEIGELVNMQNLVLSSNGFSGELPVGLSKLTQLIDMRINDNNFNGSIPDFIGEWIKIKKLHMQGCSLEGPIPYTINLLRSLTDLRISDLKGKGFNLPVLRSLDSIETLILRNCLLNGEIHRYIGHMPELKRLDLGFNNLSGKIPASFILLANAEYIFLTENKLSGPIPGWILSSKKHIDLSCNNFAWETSNALECPQRTVNLVESYSSTADNIEKIHPCVKQNFPCSPSTKERRYSLYINCGGKEVEVNNKIYEADLDAGGASAFYLGQKQWAFSSTGSFMDADGDEEAFTYTNENLSGLYATSRASATSLTYYGLCLINGNYTVRLHFAEIVFAQDRTLGKRVFDVYIQENLVLKDFNIAEEAGGAGIPIVKNFTVAIKSQTLKIRFYWAGRGTTGIPLRGDYGPLISAISVDPNFKPPVVHKRPKRVVIEVGVVVGLILLILVVSLILWGIGCFGRKVMFMQSIKSEKSRKFTLEEIQSATNGFALENKLGEGSFGGVYKGVLHDGRHVAIKQLSVESNQGARQFFAEIGFLSTFEHPNLVKLYGSCTEGQLAIVYEYMEGNSLSSILFGIDRDKKAQLNWPIRKRICLGIAKGLAYLHDELTAQTVHRDIKSSNILVDSDFNAKIADFGLAELIEAGKSHAKPAGTIGYMAPEVSLGRISDKSDVFSFGVVALELVSGIKSNRTIGDLPLLYQARELHRKGGLLELVDPLLGSEYPHDEALTILNIALCCTSEFPEVRPKMHEVVDMLEGHTPAQAPSIYERGSSSSTAKLDNQPLRDRSSWGMSNIQEEGSSSNSRIEMYGRHMEASTSLHEIEEISEYETCVGL